MKRYDENFKITALKLSDNIGVKNACEQLNVNYGKLYVSPLLDCYNGEIISLVMDTNMKKELCIKTITEAYKNFDIQSGAIIHSDCGSQYTSSEYKKMLGQLHAVQSMSGVGKCSYKSTTAAFIKPVGLFCKETVYLIR